uniref:Sphingolipid transporter 3 (putative) n=1 Tax=Strix occidentalis caurina TaxID=311401 RepID=A0A8D0FKX1_STROC
MKEFFILCYMLAAPIFGYLGDRYNRKIILGAGIFFWSGVTLGSSFISESYYWIFFISRGLVGIGTASYSTVAPTIIADLFEEGKRTTMLSIFYIFIPVGSGLGYVLAAGMADVTGDWHWAFRVSYSLSLSISHFFLLTFSWSFVWSSLGLTAMAFVTGALGMWMPQFLYRAQVVQGTVSPCLQKSSNSSNSLIFGGITIGTGILGVITGAEAARRLRKINNKADPLICATSMFISALCLYISLMVAETNILSTFIFIAFGELFLSVNWAVVTDILLYVVTPRRQSTAIALQILVSHLLGDAGSPYLIGIVSESSFTLRCSPQEYLFFLCHVLTVLGLDRARQKCLSELCLHAQLLLVQPDRRSPLSWVKSRVSAVSCSWQRRQPALTERFLLLALFFLASEETTLLIGVYYETLALSLMGLYGWGNIITDIPVS